MLDPDSSSITELIAAMRHDVSNLYERRRQAISDSWLLAIRRYNEEAKKSAPDVDRLDLLAARVKSLSDKQDELKSANPHRALVAMDRAHLALVKFSKADKGPSNLSELADAVQAFANEAALAGRALRALVGVKGYELMADTTAHIIRKIGDCLTELDVLAGSPDLSDNAIRKQRKKLDKEQLTLIQKSFREDTKNLRLQLLQSKKQTMTCSKRLTTLPRWQKPCRPCWC